MTRWNDDDAFWERMAPAMFPPSRMEGTRLEVDQVLALLELSTPAHILDLCCGPGRHSVELARRGFRVTGVDRTAAFIASASKLASEAGMDVEWVVQDARTFERERTFDAVVNLFTSFGYFDDPEQERAMLRHAYRSLRPGGRLIIDVMGKEVLARRFTPADTRELPDGSLFVELRTVRPGWEWIDSKWILMSEGQRFERIVSVKTYSAAELSALLREAGFDDLRICGSLAGTPYDDTAQRLVILATRPAS